MSVSSRRFNSRRTVNLVLHGALILAAVLILGPFLWIAAASLKTQIVLLMGHVTFKPVTLNYAEVLFGNTSTFVRNFLNSVIVASISTAVALGVGFLAGYSLLRMQWPRGVVHLFLLWSVVFNLVPPVTLAGAWYEVFRAIGLANSLVALILAHTTLHLPMALWLLSSFLREIPRELEEAAVVDGAGFVRLLRRVVVPIMMPGLVSTGILIFIFSWNEFPVALALTNNHSATVPVGIAKFAQENEIKYTQMAAASVLSAIPALLVLIFFQRFIVKGLTAGAVK
ncbi:carbohydrate ABC transporter permease [Frigidibacter sp. ROC022]|uniref:carbohydrate ABC transporter permease n=1 Tax=Frigidibacter sp. ROC022 TaxID=2971796 RepID=UPI00215A9C48|nr:carbohydrate ABC transporter permease [Frigidibacter sp. ROC022]MCR8723736.1 carbohydrate ABC transporter permease [Frigidibacter sp. ROC022]